MNWGHYIRCSVNWLFLWGLCSICHLHGYRFRKNGFVLTNRELGQNPLNSWPDITHMSHPTLIHIITDIHLLCTILLPTYNDITLYPCLLVFVAYLNSRVLFLINFYILLAMLCCCWQPSQQLHWLLTTATIGQQLYNIRDHNTSPPPSITTLLLPITNSTNYPYLNSRDGQVLGLEYKFAVNIIIVEKWIPKTTTWSR